MSSSEAAKVWDPPKTPPGSPTPSRRATRPREAGSTPDERAKKAKGRGKQRAAGQGTRSDAKDRMEDDPNPTRGRPKRGRRKLRGGKKN